MGIVQAIRDGLANVVTGAGTSVDKSAHSRYYLQPLTQHEAEAAYRSSWLTRKIVDVPPFDMTREWRDWQAEASQIAALEVEERRLCIRQRARRALILARLHGGGVLILGVNQGQLSEPLRIEAIAKGGLTYVHAMSRHQLSLGGQIMDPASPWFGRPEYFEINGAGGAKVRLHPSRVIAFVGQPVPEGATMASVADSWFWGDSIVQIVGDAVKNADRAQAGFAALIDEAAVDVIGIPDLMTSVASEEYERLFLKRMEIVRIGKSMHRALIRDAKETWETRQINWAGMPDMLTAYLNIVAGAADIPVTRLLGQSPKGLQSTGDGEERDYISMIMARQDADLRPALDQLDEVLVRSAGVPPHQVGYTFAPIAHSDPKALADIEKTAADTVVALNNTGLIPSEALATATTNRMIESGQWPGLEQALADAEAAAGEDPTKVDPEGGETNVVPLRRAANDATPRTLYVSRKLVNGAEFISWAKGQGFKTTTPADELHVTVAFSRVAIDWMKVGEGWEGDSKGEITIAPGGARLVEPLGDKGAVVLLFNSSSLSWRHMATREAGASWDFPEYQPHVTITYDGAGVDLSKVEPYRGKLVFGPEIFAEVVDGWETTITEE